MSLPGVGNPTRKTTIRKDQIPLNRMRAPFIHRASSSDSFAKRELAKREPAYPALGGRQEESHHCFHVWPLFVHVFWSFWHFLRHFLPQTPFAGLLLPVTILAKENHRQIPEGIDFQQGVLSEVLGWGPLRGLSDTPSQTPKPLGTSQSCRPYSCCPLFLLPLCDSPTGKGFGWCNSRVVARRKSTGKTTLSSQPSHK